MTVSRVQRAIDRLASRDPARGVAPVCKQYNRGGVFGSERNPLDFEPYPNPDDPEPPSGNFRIGTSCEHPA